LVVLSEAVSDIEQGMDFYDLIEDGVGSYFRDAIIADLRRLGLYFGAHAVHFGFSRALSSRFPYAIYYRDQGEIRQVVAVLDLRRNPDWIRDQLVSRK
jgi:hypothetical protein